MSHLDAVFAPGGLLARKFPGYLPRRGQLDMTRAVDAAFANRRLLLAEGPCGTGKSLAYLVPAVHHAVRHGRRVLVVTANIALQEQLVKKDLPMLAEILPEKFSFALLKGRSNYLCVDRAQETELQVQTERFDAEVDAVRRWAAVTATGDVSELPTIPGPRTWSRFSIGADDCKGKACKSYKACFAETARKRAKEAQIIVANYHILFTHLAVLMSTGKHLVLPPFDAVICDEAHEAADIAREFFGFRVTEGSVRHAAKKLGASDLRRDLEAASAAFFAGLLAARQAKDYKARLRKPPEIAWGPLAELLAKSAAVYEANRQNHEAAGDKDEAAAYRIALASVQRLHARVSAAMTFGKDASAVFFVEVDEKGRPALCSKQIDVAAALREHLWNDVKTTVLTSATLTVGGKFAHVAKELGVDDHDECAAESPFAWKDQAMLVVPTKMPDARDPLFPEATTVAVRQAILAARGRTLAIFTSRKSLDATHRAVAGKVPYRVMKQGERPRTLLVDEFRKDVSSVLMGTKSFWTGVDVSGEALSCVVIDKLPFPSPDDPIADAMSERDPDAFFNYFVPRAVTALKQGFGRLIRSTGDKGVVVVLDKRLVTKGYGRTFLKSLPPAAMSTELGDVEKFLAEKETVWQP